MIILHYEGHGKGFLSGKTEYIVLFASKEDFECNFGPGTDYADEAEYLEANASPGFALGRKYNTDVDDGDDLSSLPLERSLFAIY